ncbi:MAG: D-aminoacyl-tRNA deacylase [Nanoarchaeota archaeon]
MKTAIIISKQDPAGVNIAECLTDYSLEELDAKIYPQEKESIYCEEIDKEINADLFIFATKHQSIKGVNSLSCHCPGNWGKAEAGGKDKNLCIAPALYIKEIFLLLNRLNTLDFEVTMECTHHGPYLDKPSFFIEIGSNNEQWTNIDAGKIIAQVIIEFLKKLKNNAIKTYEVAVGIGGTHYLSKLNKFQLNSYIAIGHTCPKHMLKELDEKMIIQSIEKTTPKPDFMLLDWKGLGKEKANIIELLTRLRIPFKKTNDIPYNK